MIGIEADKRDRLWVGVVRNRTTYSYATKERLETVEDICGKLTTTV